MNRLLKFLAISCIWFVFFVITAGTVLHSAMSSIGDVLKDYVSGVILLFWIAVLAIAYREYRLTKK